jgi:hypothetical protein
MPNPQRRFDSLFADEKFELGGLAKGMPAVRASLDARDDFIKRFATDAAYVDPDETAPRLIGNWIQYDFQGQIAPADVPNQQDRVDFEEAAYLTMKKAFDDEGLGDYFESSFPYVYGIWYDPRNNGPFTANPAFPPHATVFTHASFPGDAGGDSIALGDINSLAGADTVLTIRGDAVGPGTVPIGSPNAVNIAYPHKVYELFDSVFSNPNISTDGNNTTYANPYGRTAGSLEVTVDFKLSEPEGVTLKAYFDGLNPSSFTFGQSKVAFAFREMLALHANFPIPYIVPFDQINTNPNTPF